MSFLNRFSSVFQRTAAQIPESRSDSQHWYSSYISNVASGSNVNYETAVGTAAVYTAVTAISQSIGSLPFITYERRENGGRERATKNPFYFLFSVMPNDWMTSGEWVEMILVHLLLRGNAYNFKLRDRSGRIVGLIPVNPSRIQVQQLDDMSLSYHYTMNDGTTRDLSQREIMHFRIGFSDGIVGRSPITVARETVGLTIELEQYAGRFFQNSAKPSGVLSHPAKLDKPTSDRIRESWQNAHAGKEQAWKVAVLEEGMKFEPITMTSVDAQFVEQRRFQLEDIARIFRVPPHIMGDLSRATFSNIEHQSINFVVYCLMPYIKRLEQTVLTNCFLSQGSGKELYAEFLIDGLLRGDAKSRQEGFEIMRRNGIISANEWRRLENLSPTSDGAGDKYLVPMNMTWAELLGKPAEKDSSALNDTATPAAGDGKSEDGSSTEDEPKASLSSDSKTNATRMFAETIERLIYKEGESLKSLAKRDNAEEKTEEFLVKHEGTCRSALSSLIRFYSAANADIRGVKEDPDTVEATWPSFWKSYRESSGERSSIRSMNLSETLCRLVDFRYIPYNSKNGDQNGIGNQE